MSAASLQLLQRYGVSSDPYAKRVLNPLTKPDDAELLCQAWTEVQAATAAIDRAVQDGSTAVVVVAGKHGAGRTTICNHLLAYYRDARAIDPSRFLVPQLSVKGEDAHHLWTSWMRELYYLALEHDLAPLVGSDDEALTNASALDSPDKYLPAATYAVTSAQRTLQAKGAAYAVMVEDVRNYEILAAATSIFGRTQTLVVATVLDYYDMRESVLNAFARRGDQESVLVELDSLTGAYARELIQRRWEHATRDRPTDSPFDDQALVEVFDQPRHPAGKVLALASGALRIRAGMVSPGPRWPEGKELGFDTQRLREAVDLVESLREAR